MAEPQGINVPIVITAGVVTTILTFAMVAGVSAYYNVYNEQENAAKWDAFHSRAVEELKAEQTKKIQESKVSLDQAMTNVIAKYKK